MAAAGRRLEVLQCHLHPALADEAAETALAGRSCQAAAPGAGAAAGPVVLVGGMVMDLQAHPSGPADVQRGGSVPGRVTQSAGGVARNVAEALALLLKSGGAPASQLPLLVSAVGEDLAGRALLQHWESQGLSTSCIARLAGGATPTVSVVFDLGGEVAACVADVALLERELAPALLRTPAVAAALAGAPVVMLDGNLSEAALEEACRQAAAAGVPVWFEPVSVPKSTRATSLLSCLAYVSPNEKELAAMAAEVRKRHPQRQQQGQAGQQQDCCSDKCSGKWNGKCGSSSGSGGGGNSCCSCCGTEAGRGAGALSGSSSQLDALPAGPAAAVRALLPDVSTLLLAGVRHVVLTLGADGAALCTLAPGRREVEVAHLPALPARVVNCSGAGDCLVSGCLFGLSQGLPPVAAMAHGVAAAREAVQNQANVPPGLDAAAVLAGAAAAQARASKTRLPLSLPPGNCCCCCSAGFQAGC